MLDCANAELLLNAWLDDQLDPQRRLELESHLTTCESCRELLVTAQIQDATLVRAFQPQHAAAARIADEVRDGWEQESAATHVRPPSSSMPWVLAPLSGIAGFLAAIALFYSPHTQQRAEPIASQPVATLVVSTGDVQVRQEESKGWQTVDRTAPLHCVEDAAIKTGEDVKCELMTSEGCVVRMNGGSEVSFPSSRRVELARGQIWCSSPEKVGLHVVYRNDLQRDDSPQPSQDADSLASLAVRCQGNSSLVTGIMEQGEVRVTSADGDVTVETPNARQELTSGETAQIVQGQILKNGTSIDPILACRWIQPLLVHKGHSDAELNVRVDRLLAQLGKSKMSNLYEQEIRNLGEFCVLPLLRYTQSPISRDDDRRRLVAMRIVADLAPMWTASELIGLLSDTDPNIRYYAAKALKRLTAEDQGRSPEHWKDPLPQCIDAQARWLQWQAKHRNVLVPPVGTGEAIVRKQKKT